MSRDSLIVFYGGACPRCVADRRRYQCWAGEAGDKVHWLDITGREDELKAQGIDPALALRELHVKDGSGQIHRELDAYILLMGRVPRLRPLAWLISLPVVRQLVARWYRWWV